MPGLRVVAMLAILSGCAFFEAPPEEVTETEDPAAILLTEAALAAEAALAELAQARAADNPVEVQPPPSLVPDELLAERTFDWIGPLSTLTRHLAEEAGWEFVEAGERPPTPLIVEVRGEAMPLILALRDAGIQAAEAATLTVDAPRRQVRLDWTSSQGDTI